MKTIMQSMAKTAAKSRLSTLAHRELNELEIKLQYAFDFSPHKIEYYKLLISQCKERNKKHLA